MSRSRLLSVWVVALASLLTVAGLAVAARSSKQMVSTKLGPRLCETTYGGKFVAIADFPGERIDRRLLTDLVWLEARYKIFITDGYSMDDVHSANGEHPIGLATDIVPNRAAGGTWSDIDRLAAWAEPKQNEPRAPFRWVGYDGDSGHGRGNHLHLSWNHSDTKAGIPAQTVSTIFCPTASTTPVPTPPVAPPSGAPQPHGDVDPDETPTPSGGGNGGRGGRGGQGGTSTPGGGVRNGDRSGSGSGGVAGRISHAPPVIETAGVGYNDR